MIILFASQSNLQIEEKKIRFHSQNNIAEDAKKMFEIFVKSFFSKGRLRSKMGFSFLLNYISKTNF